MKNLLETLKASQTEESKGLDEILTGKKPETEPEIEEEETEEQDDTQDSVQDESGRKFLIVSTYGELLDLAIHLDKVEKEKVVLCITEKDYQKIGEGIVEKSNDWHEYLGKGWCWVVDGCEHAGLQDWLREKGESVVGTNETMSEYENDRQKGQKLFKNAGFPQSESHNFKGANAFDEAIQFIKENSD